LLKYGDRSHEMKEMKEIDIKRRRAAMSRSQRAFLCAVVATVVFAALIFAGCSKSPMSVPSTADAPRVLSRSLSSSLFNSPTDFAISVDSVISAETGGRLQLLDVILDIPAHAVDNDTLFSITIPDVSVFFNQFGTNGLVFNVPVKVTMSYRDADLSGIDESTIRIGWLDEETGQWEDMVCQVDFENKTVTAELDHFSAYGLISD
jgi:hypothetical protein